MNNIIIYDALISKISNIVDIKYVIPNMENSKQIIGFKHRNYMYDLYSNERYQILSKERSNKLTLGVDYETLDEDKLYTTIYKKHILEKDTTFKQLCLKKLYYKKSNGLDELPRLYLAKLDHITEAFQDQYGNPNIEIAANRRMYKIGIVQNGYFIDLDNNKRYKIANQLFDSNDKICVDAHRNYASYLVELNLDEIPDKYMNLAINYKEGKCKIIKL